MTLFGLGQQKPHHYREMLKIAWENRDALPFAWRILRDGVCDGCALGRSGLSDWTIEGTHLCMVRLEAHWPEGSTLLSSVIDPDSMEPDYSAVVTLEQLP